ncbi:MAG: DUF6115 domain-containing protein [Clostridium sp.]
MLVVLIFIAVLIIIFSLKGLKESQSFSEVLINTSEEIDDVDVRIGKLRREFSETILDLQLEIQELKEEMVKCNSKEEIKSSDNIKEENITSNKIYLRDGNMVEYKVNTQNDEKECEVDLSENSIKVEQIKELYNQNFSLEEIAEKLELGKGEVLLIEELYLK